MDTIEINIWDIEPFKIGERNNSCHAELKAEIATYGILYVPSVYITSTGSYRLLDSHWRVMAARAIGMYKITVNLRVLWARRDSEILL